MNIPTKQYAQTLYKLLDGKSESEVKKTLRDFAAVLAENDDLGKLKKIIEEFGRFWNKEKGIEEAEITSAKELDKDSIKLLNGYIAKLSGAKEIIMSEKVDKDLLGGVVIKYGDKVVDGSLRTKVESLKNQMIKS